MTEKHDQLIERGLELLINGLGQDGADAFLHEAFRRVQAARGERQLRSAMHRMAVRPEAGNLKALGLAALDAVFGVVDATQAGAPAPVPDIPEPDYIEVEVVESKSR